MEFTVAALDGAISVPTAGATAADTALKNALTAGTTYTVLDGATSTPITPGTPITIKHDSATLKTRTVTVTATITWPFKATDATSPALIDNPAMTGTVSLANFGLTVTQTLRAN